MRKLTTQGHQSVENSTFGPNSVDNEMAWFRAFRGEFGYSHYGDNRTSVTADTQFVAIIYACVLISLAAIIAATGIRGKERWYTLIRVTYSLAVGSVILVSLYGYCWQIGDVGIDSSYIYRNKGHVIGTVGIRVGLQTVNLTLTGTFDTDGSNLNYNEEIYLENVLKSPDSLRHALDRGLPQPLLSVIEHFDIDTGGLRFGRSSFMAGHFAYILLWSAFAFWVTANILFISVLWYGTACFTLTGLCMTTAAIVYDYLSPQSTVKLPCSDDLLTLHYGWCFWAALMFGIVTTIIGLLLFTLEHKFPKKLAIFFLLDNPLYEDDNKISNIQLFLPSIPYSGTPTQNTLEKRRTKNNQSDNWYLNYGYENSPNRSNPVYTDTTDTNLTLRDPARPRAYSDIQEEEVNSQPDATGQNNTINDVTKNDAKYDVTENEVNRLRDVYGHVTPSLQIPSASKDSFEIEIENR